MNNKKNLSSAIILLGGTGSRFSKINEAPKQLAKINKTIILLRIIKNLNKNGFNYFIFPLGYKKFFFTNFFKSKKIVEKNNIKIIQNIHQIDNTKINIKLFDAGLNTSKLLRIKKSIQFLTQNDFLVTYGDGLANINVKKLVKLYFENNKKIAYLSTFLKKSQYGHVKLLKNNLVKYFQEKPKLLDPINIGFYIFNKYIITKYYKKNYELESHFLKKLIKSKILKAYLHKGYFFSIDSKKDILNAEKSLK